MTKCETYMTDHDRVIEALKRVPEKELLIFALARELVGADGQLDFERTVEKTPEINLAVAEARAYSRATQKAVEALRQIPAKGLSRDGQRGLSEEEGGALQDLVDHEGWLT